MAMNVIQKEAPERQEIEALLPWHATGTLSRRDSLRVEQALASDRDLARHYDCVREELNETIHLNESLGAPSARAMERLFAAIEAEAPAARKSTFDFAGRISEFLAGFSPRTLAWSAAAAAVAIVVQAAVLTSVVIKDESGQNFGLASQPTTDGTVALVRFAPQASVAEITKFLDAHKAVLTGGPDMQKGGLYKMRLAVSGLPKAEMIKLVQRMQAESKLVEFIATQE
jgi:anti-sigma-K factor RskA